MTSSCSVLDITADAMTLLGQLLKEYCPDLAAARVRIAIVWADRKVKVKGQTMPATSRITTERDRLNGLSDVVIQLDPHAWDAAGERRRLAILHRELHRIEVGRGYDDARRPKLRRRPPDRTLEVFTGILQLYGRDSVEWGQIEQAVQDRRQTVVIGRDELAFGDPASQVGANT